MARLIPPDRFRQLVAAATKTFIARGYRLTQMADVADALGVAKGTLYGYVESKEALFDASVRFADGHATLPTATELPLATPAPDATVAYIRERIAAEANDMALVKVVTGSVVIEDSSRELSLVLSDLYQRVARNRLALKLVDRCAADYPELARVWFGEGRGVQQRLLVEWLESRATKGTIRRIENPDVVARMILETVAFWAMHRHFDPAPQAVDDAIAERATIDLIVNGLLAKTRKDAS
jgi:AcrR family transcriptional regulator